MWKKVKWFSMGVIVTMIVGLHIGTAFAATAANSINVTYQNIKLFVNDTECQLKNSNGSTVEPFIYNGTVYLPVRATADALGMAVSWEPSNHSVYLGKHSGERPAIMLSKMDYYNSSKWPFEYYDSTKDNFGNTYFDSIGGGNGISTESMTWQAYALDGKYSKIKGKVVLDYDSRSDTSDYTYLKIFSDDQLVYTSPLITAGVKPADFEIDITGTATLKIEIIGNDMIRLVDCGLYQ